MKTQNLLSEFFASKKESEWNLLQQDQQIQLEKEFEEWYNEKMKDFNSSVEPAIRYLLKNHNPHSAINVNYDSTVLYSGEKCHNLTNEIPE